MTKKLGLLLFMVGVVLSGTTMAAMNGISESQWNSYDDNFWFTQKCDETLKNEVYSGYYGIYLDNFINPTGSNVSFYIHKNKVLTRGNYLLYNISNHQKGNGMTIFNRGLLESKSWKVDPGEKIRHMTTAEEVDGATFYFDWKMDNPFTAFDGKVFTVPNYRSNGTHPSTPTKSPNWDAEFRTITLYDTDDNLSTTKDNRVIVECQENVIRRCGDGILDEDLEECDPNHPDWNEETCNPDTCKKLPVCNSKFNGQPLLSLEEGPELCTVGTVKNFKYDETTRTWTWECEAAGTGTQCSATKTYNGSWKVEKTLVSETKYITKVGQELVWEIKVTAEGGDVKDMKITDKLPPVLDYVSYSVVNMPSGVKMEANQPTFSGDKKIVYWQTRGDLKAGESIVLRVVTKANAMPEVTDNYKNVACASPEGEKDKCDDEPVKTEGKLKIEKTLTGKVTVQETGEILTWDVKVTALSGDVDGFEIQDIVPLALQYIDYSVASNPDKLTVKNPTGPVKTATGNVYTWNVSGVLQSGNSLLLTVRTKVVLMPKAEDDYRNVACVIKGDNEDCDDDKPGNPDLRIKKYILSGNSEIKTGNVKIGDEITYKIKFGNNGDAVATITSIKDFLPKNVKYISSEIHIERVSSSHSSGTQQGDEEFKGYKIVDGVYIDIYGGLTLQPGDQGYIIIKAEVLSDNPDNRTNFACIYLNNEVVDCDDATHNLPGEVMCKSDITNASNDLCNGSSWTVPVTCNSDGGTGDIEIFCDGNSVLSGRNISTLSSSCTFSTDGKHTVQCKVNGSTKAISGSSCEGTYTLSHHSCGGGSSCFIAGTKVTMADGTKKNIEDVEIGEKVLGSDGTVNTVLGFHRPLLGEKELWSINGGEYFVTAEHPFMTTEGWKSLNPELTKIGMENLPVGLLELGDILITENGNIEVYSLDAKKSSEDTQLYNFKLDGDHTYYADSYLVHNKGGGTSPTCKSLNEEEKGLVCTASKNAYFRVACNGILINLDGLGQDNKTGSILIKYSDYKNCENVTCYVSDLKNNGTNGSSCVRANKNPEPKPDSDNGNIQGCFNVNAGNFSIEEGEIMPFYWNLNNLNHEAFGGKINKDNYTAIDGSNYNAVQVYEDKAKDKCDDNGKIASNSMVCTFNIYDGSGYHKGEIDGVDKNNPLYTIEGPCLASGSVINSNKLIQARYTKMKKTYCQNSNSKDCVFYYGDKVKVDVSTSSVLPTAVYYIENFGSGAKVGVYAGDFGITWNLGGQQEDKKSYGEYKIELSDVKYLQCESGQWTQKNASNDRNFSTCQNEFVLTNSYTVQKTPSGNLTASMNELKKYLNHSGTMTFDTLLNAIQSTTYKPNDNVNKAMTSFINKYKKLAVKVDISKSSLLKGTNVTVSKVPGKSIYFVYGNITINGSKKNIDTPFTIVQTSGNATISGDVGHNMMLLTDGNIIFQGNCTSDQTVKGIFYAKGNLSRSGVGKNNDINSTTWCTNGGLYVKGVLIGDSFNNLMKKSRSNLNMRFQAKGEDTEIKNERRKYLMNGASVVIEYSPSIFTKSTMPPGAEDFTTALSIYKN